MSNIASIEKIKRVDEGFYNLAVEGDESYVANGIVVHNCRSITIPITKTDIELDNLKPDPLVSLEELRQLPGGSGFMG